MQIVYAGTEFLTGDAIARALVEYSRALARVGSSESIEVPIRDANGALESAVFLVGPASQIVAMHVESDDDELTDESVVAELKTRTDRLSRPHPGQFIEDWI